MSKKKSTVPAKSTVLFFLYKTKSSTALAAELLAWMLFQCVTFSAIS